MIIDYVRVTVNLAMLMLFVCLDFLLYFFICYVIDCNLMRLDIWMNKEISIYLYMYMKQRQTVLLRRSWDIELLIQVLILVRPELKLLSAVAEIDGITVRRLKNRWQWQTGDGMILSWALAKSQPYHHLIWNWDSSKLLVYNFEASTALWLNQRIQPL